MIVAGMRGGGMHLSDSVPINWLQPLLAPTVTFNSQLRERDGTQK
jgi:hypothetical protein